MMAAGTALTQRVASFWRRYKVVVFLVLVLFVFTAVVEYLLGRSFLGPDGRFGWWSGDIWASDNSQRVADAYSFSHIIHGILFYGLLVLLTPRIPVRYRLVIALVLEAGWEILENSPLIIDRYREVTIALGYVGDSILNSLSDVVMAGVGFYIAYAYRVWMSVALIIAFEVGCLLWVRDNLTLNIIMLVYPQESIKAWQSEGHEELLQGANVAPSRP